MKIIYMGTPDFAVGPLEALIEAGHEIVLVVTQPDRAKGRSDKLIFSPVKECAVKHSIPTFQPERIKRPEAVEELRKYPADIFVVAAFGQILSAEILDMPKYGCVNIHASLLPHLRGASPIQQAILQGDKTSGVTIQQMGIGVDTGDILSQKSIPILSTETGGSLFDKLAVLGSEMIVELLPRIESGDVNPIPQDEDQADYAGMLTKAMGKIDFEEPAQVIERQVRGMDPWPGTYTYFQGKLLKIWHCGAVSTLPDDPYRDEKRDKDAPGTVIEVLSDAIYVRTGEGILRIDEVQLEGKRRMSVHDFQLGQKIAVSDKLG